MDKRHIDLTATEMGYLWSTYQAVTLNKCFLTYFDSIVGDPEIKKLNSFSLEIATKRIEQIVNIFKKENIPIPNGFNEEDIHLHVEQLYTDPIILFFQWFVGKGNLNFASLAINTIAREDVFQFYHEIMDDALNVINHSRKLLLSKGLWIRAPYISAPKKLEKIEKESFLASWFGADRPLAGIEIASIFYNMLTNSIGLSILNSFIQVTKNNEIREYFFRGKGIAQKHLDLLGKYLNKEDLPVPSTWNAGVTAATESPFSERVMLFFISFLNAQGLANYGNAIANCMRRDLGLDYTRLAAEVASYGEDGMKLLIKNGWMEKPPMAKAPVKV